MRSFARTRTAIVVAAVVIILTGCDDDATTTIAAMDASEAVAQPDASREASADASADSFVSPSDQPTPDPNEPRAVLYRPGIRLSGASGKLSFTLVSAEPPPPTKGDSIWTLLVSDSTGAPRSELTVSVVPRMPDHGHGSGTKTIVTPGTQHGTYSASPVRLFMAGLWVTTITATAPDGLTDTVRIGFIVTD